MKDIRRLSDLLIDEVRPVNTKYAPDGGISVDWSCEGVGFGNLILWWDNDGQLHADTEYMSSNTDKDFLKAVLIKLADDYIMVDQ